MKKFERTKQTIDIYGEVYNVSRPTFKRSLELGKQSDKKSDEESQELMLDFLEEMGIPKKVTMDMEVDHVTTLIEFLMPSKKK